MRSFALNKTENLRQKSWSLVSNFVTTLRKFRANFANRSAIRRDNFSTHLRGEHSFDQDAILETIKAHGYETRHLFHEVCGFCQESLPDLQSSLTHILSHLTAGQNSSTWKHQCATNHEIPVSLDHPNLARNMYANKIVNGESGDAMEVDRSPLVVTKEEDHILAVKPVMKVLRTPLPAAPVALPPPQPGPSVSNTKSFLNKF